MATVVTAQEPGFLPSVTNFLTSGIVPKELQAATFCDCMCKHYENGQFPACEVEGHNGLDVGKFVENVGRMTLECTNISIPIVDQLFSFISKLNLPKLKIKPKHQCQCYHDKVKGGQLSACSGNQMINLVQAVKEIMQADHCDKWVK